jgi:hypothetical protein
MSRSESVIAVAPSDAAVFITWAAGVADASGVESGTSLLAFAEVDLVVVDFVDGIAAIALDELSFTSVALAPFVLEDGALVAGAFFSSSPSTAFFVVRVLVVAVVVLGVVVDVAFFVVVLLVVVALRTVFLGSNTGAVGSLTMSTGSSATTFFGLPARFLTVVSAIVVVQRLDVKIAWSEYALDGISGF